MSFMDQYLENGVEKYMELIQRLDSLLEEAEASSDTDSSGDERIEDQEGGEGPDDEHLVGQGIEKAAQVGFLVQFARAPAVKEIGDGRDYKDDEGPQAVLHRGEEDKIQKHGDEHNPQKGKEIGHLQETANIHARTPLASYSVLSVTRAFTIELIERSAPVK